MPHVLIDHSANLADHLDVDELVGVVHAAVIATGVAPSDATRTRARAADHVRVGDGDPANIYVAITVRMARGRSPAETETVVDALMTAVEDNGGTARALTAQGVESQDIDPDRRVNSNHLREQAGS